MPVDDIFRLDDVSDLPEGLRKELSAKTDAFEQNIRVLFSLTERALSVDEVCAAYFRKFHEEKTRTQIMNKLYQMAKKPNSYIRSIKKGIYEKTKSTTE